MLPLLFLHLGKATQEAEKNPRGLTKSYYALEMFIENLRKCSFILFTFNLVIFIDFLTGFFFFTARMSNTDLLKNGYKIFEDSNKF